MGKKSRMAYRLLIVDMGDVCRAVITFRIWSDAWTELKVYTLCGAAQAPIGPPRLEVVAYDLENSGRLALHSRGNVTATLRYC
jgi:hypothetical protein